MGSSIKKKKEKKKDFLKPKLKVGKARPKPTNFTDTSFRSKAIVLKEQSLTITAPSLSSQFTHHLLLLSSKSDSQRRDSLSYLSAALASRPTSLQQPPGVLLQKLLPLALDGSNGVRNQLLKVLLTLPDRDVEDYAEQILLYVRAGMTHLAADIRVCSMDILRWALEVAGQEIVSCSGGWIKTLKCFLAMLGWPNEEMPAAWSASKASFGKAGNEGKVLVKNLTVLGLFLRAGIAQGSNREEEPMVKTFPLSQLSQHMLPTRSNCFAFLNVFGSPRNEESEMYEDQEDRQRVFSMRFGKAVEKGVDAAKREGGEVGRAAAGVSKILKEVIHGYKIEDSLM